jgi:hypothetical protein
MTPDLKELSITYLDSFGFEANEFVFWIQVPWGEKIIRIYFKRILKISLSRDYLDLDCDDLNVVEVEHEFRKATANDFKSYNFIVEKIDDIPKLNFVTFHSSTIIKIICEEIETKHIR